MKKEIERVESVKGWNENREFQIIIFKEPKTIEEAEKWVEDNNFVAFAYCHVEE